MIKLEEPNLEDCKKIWHWRNYEETRKITGNNRFIPWEEHYKWFQNSLLNKNRIILIAKEEEKSIGVVRFDKNPMNYQFEIGINVDPDEMKKGYGKIILDKSLKFINNKYDSELIIIAKIKELNIPSKALFLGAGFKESKKEETHHTYILKLR